MVFDCIQHLEQNYKSKALSSSKVGLVTLSQLGWLCFILLTTFQPFVELMMKSLVLGEQIGKKLNIRSFNVKTNVTLKGEKL